MTEPPSGTVTFLFTDLEGSTRLWQEHPGGMQGALARHDEILRSAIVGAGGHVVKTTGDGFHAAFGRSHDAIAAAVGAQRAIRAEQWAEVGALRVRMGVHTGEARQRDGDYYGPALNRAARLMSAAHGGQVVLSEATTELVRDELASGLQLRDLGVHQLRDLERSERVYELRVTGIDDEFPPLRSLDVYPSNLPSHLSAFVGRADDVAQILGDLEHNEVVTLTGVGGVGKTRLAVQVCADALPRFRDGAWFVDLSSVRDGDQVAPTVATVLGVKEQVGEPLSVTLRDALRERAAIVLLDNGEHLIDDVTELLLMLTSRPLATKFLVTSREPLGIDGERVRRVASLAPDDASELFVLRAANVRSDVDWRRYDREIRAICEQLDGIPLAVELAAARARSMLPPDILGRLNERFRLLQGSRRSARDRHQTLLATVEWSYDLLTAEEQTLFNRLAVFRGGFDLEAVEAVCAGGVVDELDVVDVLDRLVDKSMVLAFEGATRSSFRLLETLRQFAESKLAETGDADEYREKHVTYFLRVAAEWGPRTRSADQQAVVTRLMADRANLNAMLDRLHDDRRWSEMAGLVQALGGFWSTMSPEDGRRWIVALEPHADELDTSERIDFLAFASYIAINSGFMVDACRLARLAIDEAAAAGVDPPPYPYFALTWHAQVDGRAGDAIELARTGVALAERSDVPWIGLVIRMQAVNALNQRDPVAALAESTAVVAFADRLGVPTFRSAAVLGLGSVLASAGDRAEAEIRFAEAVRLGEGNVIHVEIGALTMRGLLDAGTQPDMAIESLRGAIDRAERHAVLAEQAANAYEGIASIWLDAGQVREAAVLLGAVDQLRTAINVRGDVPSAPLRERLHADLPARLGPQEYERLAARGRALTRDEVRRFALGDFDPIPDDANATTAAPGGDNT